MRTSNAVWSFAVLLPLVGVALLGAGPLAVSFAWPSLTFLGQLLVIALGVFAVWAGLADDGH